MKALRWHARGDVRLDEVDPPPPPRPGEVQLEVLWCGICATDYEEFLNGPIFLPIEPHPLTGARAPITLGHEVSGRVTAAPAGSRLRPGDRVAVDGLSSCGTCSNCAANRVNLCEQLAAVGLMSDGGLAEFVNVPEHGCVVLPDHLGSDVAALAETLSVGVRALKRGRLKAGERVVVVGGGAVGLLTAQAARAMGAGWVAVSDPSAARRALALELGADEATDPGSAPSLGADVVVECAGSSTSLAGAVAAAAPAGRIVAVGITKEAVPLDVMSVVGGEREILGSLSHVYDEDFVEAVRLLARGDVRAEPLITARIPLTAALQRGLMTFAEPDEQQIKILVGPALPGIDKVEE